MSRRKTFETSLSGAAAGVSKQRSSADSKASNNNKQQSKMAVNSSNDRSSSSMNSESGPADGPGTITPPDPSHATLHVPTVTERTGKSGSSKSGSSVSKENGAVSTTTPPEIDDSGLCFICAEPVTFWAVGVCNHRVCHVCAIRLRVFYKMLECAYCKTHCPSLLFTRSPTVPFPENGPFLRASSPKAIAAAQAAAEKPENKGKKWYQGLTLPGTLDLSHVLFADEKLGVAFEDEEMMETSLQLLRFNCPYTDCPHMSNSWSGLEKHTLAEHGLVLCKLCTRQLSRFSHEQVLYPPNLLALHDPSRLSRGQRAPRPRTEKDIELVKTWDAPHPMCEFCHEAFFGPDELFTHMRDRHEKCFVCNNMGQENVYFQNYAKLEEHFNRDHFPCSQPVCIEKKFQVFGSQLDLRAHMMTEHGEAMSQRDRAQARQIPIEFSSRQEAGPSHGHGRGFTLSTPMRDSAPQRQQIGRQVPMDAEQAAQHRRQVQVDRQEEGRRRRAFATGLSGEPGSASVSGPASGRRTPEESASGFATPREDVDDATANRHALLLSRVSMLVADSPNKVASFRSSVRQFKNNESSARDMVDTLFHVFDEDPDTTSGVLREIANLFDGDGERDKQRAVLEALNAFRVELREQFPALGGIAPSGLGNNYADVSSGRILSAKRATHTGGGRTNSRSVWDRVEAAAASHPVNRPAATTGVNGRFVPGASATPASSFPSLGGGGGGSSSSRSGSSSTAHSTPWASGGAGSTSKTPSALAGPQIRSVNFPTVSASKPKQLNTAAFPSLPTSSARATAAAERAALFTKPTPRDESIRRITGQGPVAPSRVPAGNSWSTCGATTTVNGTEGAFGDLNLDPTPAQGAAVTGGAGGGKKKGKGKQLLFSVSARP